MQFNREDLRARYALFNQFALQDQKRYYSNTLRKNSMASRQVNFVRAMTAFLTGASAASAGLVSQVNGSENLIAFFTLLAIVLPAFGALFSSLADLYQWDKLNTVYESALENLEVADALSPLDEMPEPEYRATLRAFAEGSLSVMNDETAQWGQAIRTPQQIEDFLKAERLKADLAHRSFSADADDSTPPTG